MASKEPLALFKPVKRRTADKISSKRLFSAVWAECNATWEGGQASGFRTIGHPGSRLRASFTVSVWLPKTTSLPIDAYGRARDHVVIDGPEIVRKIQDSGILLSALVTAVSEELPSE